MPTQQHAFIAVQFPAGTRESNVIGLFRNITGAKKACQAQGWTEAQGVWESDSSDPAKDWYQITNLPIK